MDDATLRKVNLFEMLAEETGLDASEVESEALGWTEEDIRAYFASGGRERPAKSTPLVVVYGSYGYTGRIVCEYAVERGLTTKCRLRLAGRDEAKLRAQAETLSARGGVEYTACALDNPRALDAALEGAAVVLHIAGPYEHTCAAMAEACVRAGAHYLDLSGEHETFDWLNHQLGARAVAAGVALIPGVGFDVVPTDCAALCALERLGPPNSGADSVHVVFDQIGTAGPSRGTARVIQRNMQRHETGTGVGTIRRVNGKRMETPITEPIFQEFDLGRAAGGKQPVLAITYADVASSEATLPAVPNFSIYAAGEMLRAFCAPPSEANRRILEAQASSQATGPSLAARQAGRIMVHAEAATATYGRRSKVQIWLDGDGYEVTKYTAVLAIEEVLQRVEARDVPAGYTSPARFFGSQFIVRACGASFVDL